MTGVKYMKKKKKIIAFLAVILACSILAGCNVGVGMSIGVPIGHHGHINVGLGHGGRF